MKNIWNIMSKEFARFFGDKRMILMVILPAVLIYAMYSFMGTMMAGVLTADEDHIPRVYAVNMSQEIAPLIVDAGIDLQQVDAGQIEMVKQRIVDSEADLLMVFPSGFDAQVEVFDIQTATEPAPNIEMYFISTDPNSAAAYWWMVTILDVYHDSLANKFDINRDILDADMASDEDVAAMVISMMMPMLLMIFLYSGSMGLALESITGEKERGTIATLLVTPLKRRELAIGKILSLAALSFLSGTVTAVATILALPNMMGGADEMIDVNIYSITDYVLLALVILTTLLLMVTLISIISAFAKTVKEAGQAQMPLMIVIMLVGVSGMLGVGTLDNIGFYLIPIFGSVQSMSGIFALDYSMVNILIACLANLVYAGLGGFVLTKMFNSEKIMFSR